MFVRLLLDALLRCGHKNPTKRILYIEDSTTSQYLVKKYLESSAEVFVASSLSKADTMFAERRFDVVVTDYMLPDGSAMRTVRDIRKLYSPLELPIILASASLDKSMVSEALQSGVNECLPKPLQREGFIEIVRKMLSAPYVTDIPDDCDTYTSIQWTQAGKSLVFCPELRETTQGTNPAEAAGAMLELARNYVKNGHGLGLIYDVRVSSRFLKFKKSD